MRNGAGGTWWDGGGRCRPQAGPATWGRGSWGPHGVSAFLSERRRPSGGLGQVGAEPAAVLTWKEVQGLPASPRGCEALPHSSLSTSLLVWREGGQYSCPVLGQDGNWAEGGWAICPLCGLWPRSISCSQICGWKQNSRERPVLAGHKDALGIRVVSGGLWVPRSHRTPRTQLSHLPPQHTPARNL